MTTDNRTNEQTPEQVEAAATALHYLHCGCDGMMNHFGSMQDKYREQARAAIAAADAVVTVEMIAAALHSDECPDDPDEGESCSCDGNHYMRQGEIVLALLRGGGEDGA